ncbi:hypothetical protein GCM10022393_01850 [Aquimarina addita]|uniref:Spore coat protein CotH n=1 Tax=Aquimarina addita TaxID=870485 RepID=A0ABP7X880_9FLAO
MKNKIQYLCGFLCLWIISSCIYSQNSTKVTPVKGSYGIDKEHKIIVWNGKKSATLSSIKEEIHSIEFDGLYQVQDPIVELSKSKNYSIAKEGEQYALYITALPIINITSTDTIIDDRKRLSGITYADKDTVFSASAGIEFRGNISLSFPKKSYDLEFWENGEEEKSTEIKFGSLRSDDDWILDGLYNEPIRLRSYICNKLWLSIHQPYYLSEETKAKSGIDLIFVEAFLNNQYIGIHTLSEQVDRKLLKLQKYENGKVRGELFKASSYEGAPAYQKVPEYNNIFPHWGGYKMEYPFIDYKGHWENIHAFTDFVVNSSDKEFTEKIAERFVIDNAIDYFLFVNLIRATDNLGKNIYVARYDQGAPYFNVPWDLDGVLGTIQDGKRIATTDDILSNGLFDRLLKVNPNGYVTKLKNRWVELRKKQFSDASLFKSIQKPYDFFENEKIYERELHIWPADKSNQEHLDYLVRWLKERLKFLDMYFEKL